MNYKKNITFSLVIVGTIPILSFLVSEYPANIGLCKYAYDSIGQLQGRTCIVDLSFLQPLFFLSLVTFIFLLPLYFLKEGVYLSWRKFALWYLPIVTFALIISPASEGNGLMSVGVGGDRESLTFFFSGLFAIISLILIIYKSIKLRGA